jgi:hypothetical protein
MVIDNIVEYMNTRSDKTFTRYEASAIRDSIKFEKTHKHLRPNGLNTRTKQGRKILNQRVSDIVKAKYGVTVTAKDVWIYKKCFADEYSARTGRCAWGFKEKRRQLGYDPDTGLELTV